jgi:hypothetical protein
LEKKGDIMTRNVSTHVDAINDLVLKVIHEYAEENDLLFIPNEAALQTKGDFIASVRLTFTMIVIPENEEDARSMAAKLAENVVASSLADALFEQSSDEKFSC